MSRPALILNPRARRLRRRPGLLREIEALAAGRGDVFSPASLPELDEVSARIVAMQAPTVLIAGGDGTFMYCVTALCRAYGTAPLPRIVLCPAGTVNTIARNFGASRDVTGTIERVLSGAQGARLVRRATLQVEEQDGPTRVGFIVGTGLVARFFEKYEAAGAGGYGTALGIVLRAFVGSFTGSAYSRSILDPLPCKLAVEGTALPLLGFSLIVSAVIPDLGLGMRVTYRAAEDPERLHLVASALPPVKLGPQWPRVALGLPLSGPDCFDGVVRSFSIDFGDTKGPYVLDGDTFRARHVTVRPGPRVGILSP